MQWGLSVHVEQCGNRQLLHYSIFLINGRQERGQDVLADGEVIQLLSLHSLSEGRESKGEGNTRIKQGRRKEGIRIR